MNKKYERKPSEEGLGRDQSQNIKAVKVPKRKLM